MVYTRSGNHVARSPLAGAASPIMAPRNRLDYA